jgi:pimeloyl-ACP methyl ester carboxylesterase
MSGAGLTLQVDGRAAYAYTGGKPFDATLPCVVFLHGACHDHSVWTLLARWFAHHGYGVLAVDLPGHSRSAGPLLPDIQAHAQWLLALLDAAGVQRAALVGHSMGSLIALQAAGQAPERVSHLALLGTAVPMKVSDTLLATARQDPLAGMKMVNTWSISSTASKPGFPSPGNWLHGGSLALMRRVQAAGKATGQATGKSAAQSVAQSAAQSPNRAGSKDASPHANVFSHGFEICNAYSAGLEAAARVRCPVTCILGRADQMTPPRAASALAQALNAKTVVLESGHHLMAEVPEALGAALRLALVSTHLASA